MTKTNIRFKNTKEVINALEEILNIKFKKWSFSENGTGINFCVKASSPFEDIIIDIRKSMSLYISFKDGNGNFIKDDNLSLLVNKNFIAEKGRDFDELFDNTVKAVSENRANMEKINRIDPDGQMWLF